MGAHGVDHLGARSDSWTSTGTWLARASLGDNPLACYSANGLLAAVDVYSTKFWYEGDLTR